MVLTQRVSFLPGVLYLGLLISLTAGALSYIGEHPLLVLL